MPSSFRLTNWLSWCRLEGSVSPLAPLLGLIWAPRELDSLTDHSSKVPSPSQGILVSLSREGGSGGCKYFSS